MRNREEAAKAAEATVVNKPGWCQAQVAIWFQGKPVGDFDGDGAADAEDGWKSEGSNQVKGDRHPPRGVPVSYLGGSHDNGHRAISLGNGLIRSTDAGGVGIVATVPLDWPEKNWGLTYVGWSPTFDGEMIPLPPKPPRIKKPTRVSAARALLLSAKGWAVKHKNEKRADQIQKALDALPDR